MYSTKFSVLFFLSFISTTWSIDCEFAVEMTQKLRGSGFHRNLTYTIQFLKEGAELATGHCVLSLDQLVPAGLYANPDELYELNQAGKLIAKVRDRIDVEMSAEKSNPATVYVMATVDGDKVLIWVPLHARYHKAVTGGGFATVNISPPRMFVVCPNNLLAHCRQPSPADRSGLCPPSGDCEWKSVHYTLISEQPSWLVPVGDLSHWHLAAIGTSLAYLAGTVYVLKALHGYKRRPKLADSFKREAVKKDR